MEQALDLQKERKKNIKLKKLVQMLKFRQVANRKINLVCINNKKKK